MIDSFLVNDYSRFKALIEKLEPGESNNTFTVIAADETQFGAGFIVVAGFATRVVSLRFDTPVKPATFDADFPRAIIVDSVLTV